jgi:hypothetical protein
VRLVTEEDREFLLKQARRCHSLLKGTTDEKMRKMLTLMAREYEERAAAKEIKK